MLNRDYKTIHALRAGNIVDVKGLRLRMRDGEIQPGDLYVAECNTGPRLLTCRGVSRTEGWIMPTTADYGYDIWECVRVEEA